MITIKFNNDSVIDTRYHQISKKLIEKYPDSIFNFCNDFDQNTIILDMITFDEFEQVLKCLNENSYYGNIKNKQVKLFIKKYIYVDELLDDYNRILKTENDVKLKQLQEFIYGKEKFYIPNSIETYEWVKKKIRNNKNILSVQYIHNPCFSIVINISETLPIFRTKNSVDYILQTSSDNIDVNYSRHQMLEKFISKESIPKDIYSTDDDKFLKNCALLVCFTSNYGQIVVNNYEIKPMHNGLKYDQPERFFPWNQHVLDLVDGDNNKLINIIVTHIKNFCKSIGLTNILFQTFNIIFEGKNVGISFVHFFFINVKNIVTQHLTEFK